MAEKSTVFKEHILNLSLVEVERLSVDEKDDFTGGLENTAISSGPNTARRSLLRRVLCRK